MVVVSFGEKPIRIMQNLKTRFKFNLINITKTLR